MTPMENMAISMLGKLTGLSPDEMQSMAGNAINILQTLETRLNSIEENILTTKAMLHCVVSDLNRVEETRSMVIEDREAHCGTNK